MRSDTARDWSQQDARLTRLGWRDRVLLAPMSGVTDRPFRDHIRSLGQGQVVTEMIASEAAIREIKDSRKLNQAIDDVPDDASVLVLYGDVPLVRAATLSHLVDAAATDALALLTVVLDDPAYFNIVEFQAFHSIRSLPCQTFSFS